MDPTDVSTWTMDGVGYVVKGFRRVLSEFRDEVTTGPLQVSWGDSGPRGRPFTPTVTEEGDEWRVPYTPSGYFR